MTAQQFTNVFKDSQVDWKYILITIILTFLVSIGILVEWLVTKQGPRIVRRGENIFSEEKSKVERVLTPVVNSNEILLMLTKIPTNYENFRDRYVALESLDITTGQKAELIRWPACEATVVLSPDKDKMAYFMRPNGQCEREYYGLSPRGETKLWISDLSNQDKQFIADGVWDYTFLKWSPDGRYLAYEKVVEHPYPQEREHKLFLYDLQNKNKKFLGSSFGAVIEIIGFSQEHNFIYYEGELDELFKINVANQERLKIYTPKPGFNSAFVMSPNGKKIAVFDWEEWYGGKTTPMRWKIGVIDTSTDSYRELYNGTDPLTHLMNHSGGGTIVFSKDSSYVIYGITSKGINGGLWTIDLTSGNRKKLKGTSALSGIAPIALSLDGKLLLYTDFKLNHQYYYVLSLSTGVIKKIVNIDTSLGEVPISWLN